VRPEPAALEASAPRAPGSATASASIVTLEQGLHLIEIVGPATSPSRVGEVTLPLIRLAEWPSVGGEPLAILSAAGVGGGELWLDGGGGVAVVRAPAGGGRLVVTVFGPADQPSQPARISARRLNGADAAIEPSAGAVAQGRDIPIEILLHVERIGDRLFPASGWVGARGERKRIEGFGIRSLAAIPARDIHYKAIHPGGVETAWIAGPQLCGSRGRGLPLVGFAVRIAPHLQSQFDVSYRGAFFTSGVAGPNRNGELCRPRLPDDPLEAMVIQITERAPN
jgi:hypothetical protein